MPLPFQPVRRTLRPSFKYSMAFPKFMGASYPGKDAVHRGAVAFDADEFSVAAEFVRKGSSFCGADSMILEEGEAVNFLGVAVRLGWVVSVVADVEDIAVFVGFLPRKLPNRGELVDGV